MKQTDVDPGCKGFYMSIDITIASGIAILILITLLITFSNIPGSDVVDLANYKLAESALYSLKHDGTLDQVIGQLDDATEGKAIGTAVSRLAQYNLPLHPTLKIRTYDNTMTLIHSFKAQKGPSTDRKYAVSMAYKPNGTTSKFAIVTLEVGR